jgi:FlaA1/EpsC-like NDP-sugar epimerase
MGEPVKILDLATRMVHLSGLEVRGVADDDANDAIEIRHVGLRPGEKLYEELLIGTNVEGTQHPLIMRAQETEIPWSDLQKMLALLQRACDQFDYEQVRTLLLQIVAEYAPQCGIEDLVWLQNNLLSDATSSMANQLAPDDAANKPGLRQVSP